MLATWFRLKYPWLVEGVIAGSAPVWAFLGLQPPYDSGAYDRIVTADASAAGGASDACSSNFRAALPLMAGWAKSRAGRDELASVFRTCRPLASEPEALALVDWVQQPWATLAMGNYPYASSYLMHGESLLPPWPVRAACQFLDVPIAANDTQTLFSAVREAIAVYYNNTGAASCFFNGEASATLHGASPARSFFGRTRPAARAPPSSCGGDWDWQWCTEMVMPFSSGLSQDMVGLCLRCMSLLFIFFAPVLAPANI